MPTRQRISPARKRIYAHSRNGSSKLRRRQEASGTAQYSDRMVASKPAHHARRASGDISRYRFRWSGVGLGCAICRCTSQRDPLPSWAGTNTYLPGKDITMRVRIIAALGVLAGTLILIVATL